MKKASESSLKPSYHHGDLHRTLVDAAVQLIGAAGIEALTLREIGQRVGVSRSAPYRHFQDKEALLAAVALEGFRLLRGKLEAIRQTTVTDEIETMVALSQAYVRFGAEHPARYRTMFGATWGNKHRYPELDEAGNATAGVLVESIVQGQRAGRLAAGDPLKTAQIVWSLLHGLVMLREDDHFTRRTALQQEDPFLAGHAMRTLLSGLLVHGNP